MTNSNDCFEVFCVKLCEIASNECPSVSNECQISVKVCQISAKSGPKRGKGVSKEYFISLKPRTSARKQKKPGRSSETPKKEGGQPSEPPKKEGGQSSETPKKEGGSQEAGAILRNPEKGRREPFLHHGFFDVFDFLDGGGGGVYRSPNVFYFFCRLHHGFFDFFGV